MKTCSGLVSGYPCLRSVAFLLCCLPWFAHAESALINVAEATGVSGTIIDTPVAYLSDTLPKNHSGWMVRIDNDNDDTDFTGGLSLQKNLSGLSGGPLQRARGRVDRLVSNDTVGDGLDVRTSLTIGLLAFTPGNIASRVAQFEDRPFANLIYASNSRRVVRTPKHATQSTLTVGVLGSNIFPVLQKHLHRLTGSRTPRGYDNQISDGGELTFRYARSDDKLLVRVPMSEGKTLEIQAGGGVSVGFVTEASLSISARWGRLNSSWWERSDESGDYLGEPLPLARSAGEFSRKEIYYTAGLKIRARAYNALLQGQLRHSPVTFSGSQLNHLVADAWIGMTYDLTHKVSLSYVVHHQTAEIKSSQGGRSTTWASLTINRAL